MMHRCKHDIYNPDVESELAWACTSCYPQGHPDADATMPHFNRRSSLNLTETGKLPKCPGCGSIIAISHGGVCKHCGVQYEIQAPEHLRANNIQAGICPDCGSGVHMEGKNKRIWICADCDKEYPAPKRVE